MPSRVLLLNLPSFPGSTTDRRQRCTVKSPHNWVHPPIALAYLASSLKQWNQVEVKLIDAVIEKYDLEDVIKIVKEFKPKLIVSPIGSYSFLWDFKVLSKIKAEFDCLTLGFGELPTAFPEKFLTEYKNLDFCIRGEPEIAVSKLAHHLKDNLDIKEIPNLSYKINNQIFSNPVEIIEDLDSIPFPDRSLLKNEKYHCIPFFSELFTDLVTSKGCPYNCKFCTTNKFWGKKFRVRSPENILEEVKECIEKFKIKSFFIPDETFTADRAWVKKIVDGFKDLSIKWALQTRVDLVDKEILREMADSGCLYVHYGAESGSQRILDYYQKGITVQRVRDAFKWSRQVGVETCATFIIGSPEETADSAEATIQLAKEIKADYYHFSPLIPNPLSDFFQEFKEKGLLKHYRFEEYVKPNIVFKSKYLSEDEIRKFLKKAYRTTIMNPTYALRRFGKVLKRGDLAALKALLAGAWWTFKTFISKK